jgi:preprotein translocase subunit SecG
MYNVVLILHIFVCVLLIVAVLLQSGKGGDIGSALGGGGSNSGFGPAAPANVLNKITTGIAACFLLLSLVLALMAGNKTPTSIMQGFGSDAPAQTEQAPFSNDIDR